jgi:transcriptional regulator with XRE-family HTH domain
MTTKRRRKGSRTARSDETVEILARNVRDAREALGLSQEQLARAAKVTAADISRIEHAQQGARGIGLVKLGRIAAALRRTSSELLAETRRGHSSTVPHQE